MTPPPRVAVYARCSSQKQADRDLSVPAQLDACRAHAAAQGWMVVADYHDDGISGFEDERRPAFTQMMAEAARPSRSFDHILVWDLSRFSRSVQFSLQASAMLEMAGVRLVSMKEHTDSSPSGWLMGTIARSFNEYQVRKLAEDTRRGMRKNAAEGGWNGGAVPVGYQVQRDERGRGPGRLVPDPHWAPLVQRIFALSLAGQGASTIVSTLNDEGLRTQLGRRWNKQSVLYLLRNEVYAGVYTWGVRANGKFATEAAAPLRIEGAHEALVSSEDFARVGAVIEQRRPSVTHPRTTTGSYLLSGVLVCAACGSPYIGHGAKGGQHQYYACQKKQKQGAKACLGARSFAQAAVEGLVLDALRDGALHPAVFGDLVREVQASLRAAQSLSEGERLVLKGQIIEVERRLEKLYEAIESSSIPLARLAPRIDAVSQEREALVARLGALPASGSQPLLEIDDRNIGTWLADLRAVVERGTVDERRGLLRAWIQRVVADGDRLTIEFTFPLVGMGGPDGAAGGGPPGRRSLVYKKPPRRSPTGAPETRKGEPALRRVLPTVVNGSPSPMRRSIGPPPPCSNGSLRSSPPSSSAPAAAAATSTRDSKRANPRKPPGRPRRRAGQPRATRAILAGHPPPPGPRPENACERPSPGQRPMRGRSGRSRG